MFRGNIPCLKVERIGLIILLLNGFKESGLDKSGVIMRHISFSRSINSHSRKTEFGQQKAGKHF